MQLQSTSFTLLALATTLPAVSAATWNDQLKVWNVDPVDTEEGVAKHKVRPSRTIFACGGISEGGYVCGSFEDEGVDGLRAVYRCDRGTLRFQNVCYESDKYNRCVKNGRRKSKKFFPCASTEKVVCQTKKNVEKP
jgi:hypothetical protein